MAISFLDNINIKKKAPNVERDLFATIEDMVAWSENYLPDVFETNVIETGKRYRYNRSNEVDLELGKWRVVGEGEGDVDLTDYYKKSEVNNLLEDKVDKETDKGLSTNDYSDTEKTKLQDVDTLVNKSVALTTTATTITEAINELVTSDADLQEQITENAEELEKLKKSKAIAVDEKPTYEDGVITYKQDGETKTTEDTDTWFYYSVETALYQTIWISGTEKTIQSGGVDFEEFVKKTQVVDNLTSTATDKPLSANMGKKLNDDMTQGLSEKLDIAQGEEYAGYIVKVGEDGNLELVEVSEDVDASSVDYEHEDHETWNTVKKALDGIIAKVFYVAPKITSFTMSPSATTYEVGQTVDSLTFNWGVNKDITTQSLTGCTVALTDRTATYSTPITTSKTFTLSIGDGENTASSSLSVSFKNKNYYGSAPRPENFDSSFILGLSNKDFATAVKGTYNMNVASGEYGWLCVPSSYAQISSWYVGGFEVDLVNEGTISFTNASGGVVTYRLYRTTQPSLGSIKVEVK